MVPALQDSIVMGGNKPGGPRLFTMTPLRRLEAVPLRHAKESVADGEADVPVFVCVSFVFFNHEVLKVILPAR